MCISYLRHCSPTIISNHLPFPVDIWVRRLFAGFSLRSFRFISKVEARTCGGECRSGVRLYTQLRFSPAKTFISSFVINQLDAPISQIYFVMKCYMFRAFHLSIIRSLFTVHSTMVYVIQVCRQLLSRRI